MSIEKLLLIKIAADVDEFKDKIKDSGNTIKNLQDGFSSARGVMSGDVTQLESVFTNLGEGFSRVGNQMTTYITTPLLGLGKLAIDAFSSYESSLTGVAKTFPGTQAEFEKLTGEMDKLATVLPQPINKIHEVAEAAGQLGISQSGILDFTEVMLNLGVSTNMSAEDAATALARMANIMGTTESDYSKLGSTIVDLGNNYATTEEDIVNFALRLSGAGKQVGMSEADVLGIATGLSSLGINAEAGGTAMSKFMSSMSLASERGLDDMLALEKQTGYTGRELEILSKNDGKKFKAIATSVGMTTTELTNVVKANKDLTAMSKVAGVSMEEFSKIFKDDAAVALAMFFEGMSDGNAETASSIELLQDMGINEARLRDMILRTTNAKGMFTDSLQSARSAWEEDTALTEEAEKRYATFESQMILLKNELGLLGKEVGEKLAPILMDIVDFIKDLSSKIREMPAEKFEAWVKVFLGLGAAGPVLSLVGKIFTTISSVKPLMDGATKATGKLFDLFMGDGASAGKAVGEMSTELVHLDGKVTGIIPNLKNLAKDGLDAVKTKMSASTGVMGSMYTKVTALSPKIASLASSFASNALPIAAYVGYVANAVSENERLDSLVDAGIIKIPKLGDVFGPVGDVISKFAGFLGDAASGVVEVFDTVTGGVLGMGDLAVTIGSIIALPFAPWLGIAGLAAVATKGLIGGLAESMYQAQYETIYFNEAMNRSEEDLKNSLTVFDKFADETIPGVQTALDEMTKSAQVARFTPSMDNLLTEEAELQSHLDNHKNMITGSYDALIKQTQSFHEQNGTLNSQAYTDDINFLLGKQQEEEQASEVASAELMALNKKYHDDKASLTAEEWARYQELLTQLDIQAKELQAIRDGEDVKLLEETLKQKRELGLKLTDQEIKELYDKKETALKSEYELIKQSVLDERQLLDLKYSEGKISLDEYNAQKEALTLKNTQALMKMETDLTKTLLATVTGRHESEITAMIENNGRLIKAQEEHNNASRLLTEGLITQEEFAIKQANLDRARDEAEKYKLSKEEQDAYMEYVKKNFPEDMHEAMGLVKGKFNLDFIEKTLDASLKASTTYKQKFETLGRESINGLIVGLQDKAKIAALRDAGKNLAGVVLSSTSVRMDIRSPSREMAKLGRFAAEGLAVGITEEIGTAEKASEALAQAVLASGLSPEDLRMDLSRDILTNVSANATITTDSVFEATMSKVLESANITAVISRGEFDRGVESKVTRDKRRVSAL